MSRQDYILRMIEIAGRVLKAILRGLRSGELGPAEARDRLRDAAHGAGIDLDLLRSVDLDTLVLMVSPGGEPEPGRCWITAEMFAVEAFGAEAAGDTDASTDAAHRALRLYALVDPSITGAGLDEVPQRVDELRALLERLDGLPPERAPA